MAKQETIDKAFKEGRRLADKIADLLADDSFVETKLRLDVFREMVDTNPTTTRDKSEVRRARAAGVIDKLDKIIIALCMNAPIDTGPTKQELFRDSMADLERLFPKKEA